MKVFQSQHIPAATFPPLGIWKYQHFSTNVKKKNCGNVNTFAYIVFPADVFNECSKRKLGEWGRRISYNAVYNDLHILWENQIYETSTLFTEKENVSGYLNAQKTLSLKKCTSAEEIMVLPTKDEIFKLFTNFCSYVKISQKVRTSRRMNWCKFLYMEVGGWFSLGEQRG